MTLAPPTSAPPLDEPAIRPARAGSVAYSVYVTFVMALVFMLATADRNIMSILLVPMQKDLGVGDAAMGALSGTAFSIVYAVAALPLAWVADRGNRRNLIAGAVVVWSVFTSLCGLASGFVSLLLSRVGVAAGEAASGPAVMSMVSDLYPRTQRGIAIGCITMGSAVGIGLGAWISGVLSDLHGWRTAFLVMGVPGVLVGLLMLFTVREPARGTYEGAEASAPTKESVWATLVYIARVPSVPRLLAAKLALQMAFGGFLLWAPTFFIRVHDLTTSEMSAGFGAVVGLSAILSAIIAGVVSDRLARGGERWRAYYCAAVLAGGSPFIVAMLFAPTPTLAFAALFVTSLITGGATSASITAGLGVVRPATRGFMTAAMSFCIAVVGGGVGPVLFGAISDGLVGRFGDDSLRFALMLVPVLWVLSALLFWYAGRTTDQDSEAALQVPSVSTVL